MKLAEHLKAAAEKKLPMHMPGHKRRAFAHLEAIDYQIDFTETPDSDDLHHPHGLLLESQQKLSSLYGSIRSFYSVNGSTACILAAIRAVTKRGDRVIVARNCHKAVFNALELCGLDPVYILPKINDHGLFLQLDPEELLTLLEREGDVALVVLTSPTYEGGVSDIGTIADLCHRKGALLLVDEAHGAHLGFFDPSLPSSVTLGADLVVQSFHKTLPSFTQTAVLHLCSGLVDADRLASQMALFQSSSPSYLLLASLDGCVDYILSKGRRFAEWENAVSAARDALRRMKKLRLYDGEDTFSYDRSKICILTDGAGMTGYQLYDLLYEKGIVCELAGYNLLVAMTGAADDEQSLTPLVKALLEIDERAKGGGLQKLPPLPPLPKRAHLPCDCYDREQCKMPLEEAIGQVCAQMVYLYPPGIPMILQGEPITEEFVKLARFYLSAGIEVNGLDGGISVLKD